MLNAISIKIVSICVFLFDYGFVDSYDCENPGLPKENGLYVIPNIKTSVRNDDHALMTTPPGFSVRKSSLPNAGLGVFTETYIPKNTRIGPYDGIMYSLRCEECDKKYTWAVRYDNTNQVKYYIDATPKSHSSWIRYINCANTVEQENLYFYQYNYEIYYVTYECIKPGTELLVWYGDKYGKHLGLSRKPEDYMRRFNETDRRLLHHTTLTYGSSKKIFNHCHQFVDMTPVSLRNQTKLCRHWKAFITCRYFDCDVNPCSGFRDCENCEGYCFHSGHYFKPNQELVGGDNVNKLQCQQNGTFTYSFQPSSFVDMCLY